MKFKKLLGAIAATITALSACVFTSCGSTGGTSANTDPNDPYSGIEITVGIANNASETAILNTFRTAYLKKYPGRKIKIDRFTGEFDNELGKRVRSENVPEVIQVYDFSAEYWTSKGVYAPLDDRMTAAEISDGDFFDQIVAMMKSGTDGKKYWAARDYNKIVVAVNKEMFKIAGIEIPSDEWTWDDFVAICEALEAKSADIRKTSGQEIFYAVDANLNWEAVYYPAVKSFGGDLFDVENSVAYKNLDGIKEGFGKLLSLVDSKLAVNPADASTSPFAVQQAAMSFIVRPEVASIANALKDENGESQLDFVAMPSFTGENVTTSYIGVGCTGYALSSTAEGTKADAAWEFIKYIISEEGQRVFAESGAGIPVLKDLSLSKDAPFRSYLPNANHDAFIKYSERDLPLNYMHGINADKHLAIRSVLKSELMKNLANATDREAYYSLLKEKLEGAMR